LQGEEVSLRIARDGRRQPRQFIGDVERVLGLRSLHRAIARGLHGRNFLRLDAAAVGRTRSRQFLELLLNCICICELASFSRGGRRLFAGKERGAPQNESDDEFSFHDTNIVIGGTEPELEIKSANPKIRAFVHSNNFPIFFCVSSLVWLD
jgi:hypothetical protein